MQFIFFFVFASKKRESFYRQLPIHNWFLCALLVCANKAQNEKQTIRTQNLSIHSTESIMIRETSEKVLQACYTHIFPANIALSSILHLESLLLRVYFPPIFFFWIERCHLHHWIGLWLGIPNNCVVFCMMMMMMIHEIDALGVTWNRLILFQRFLWHRE